MPITNTANYNKYLKCGRGFGTGQWVDRDQESSEDHERKPKLL